MLYRIIYFRRQIGKYVHVLLPADRHVVTEELGWQGRIRALERTVTSAFHESEARVASSIHKIENENADTRRRITELMKQNDELKQNLAVLNSRLDDQHQHTTAALQQMINMFRTFELDRQSTSTANE